MTFEVELTEQADVDLRSIFEYIAFDLKSPGHAVSQIKRLEESILMLDTFPEAHPL